MFSKMISFWCMVMLHFSIVSAEFLFSQNATGPNSVCEGSDVTLQCRVMFSGSVRHSVWFRNGTAVRVGNDFIPNHFINFTNGYFTDLVITDVTMADNNTVYTCNSIDDSITSSVVLNVSGPPSTGSVTSETCLDYIMLSWNVTNDQKACGKALCNLSMSHNETVMMTKTVNNNFYKFLNLTPGTNYTISLQHSNDAGSGRAYTDTMRTAPNSTLTEVCDESSTYIVIKIIPINEMYCGGASAVTYTTTVSPSDGQVDVVNQTIHNITGLVENTTYAITTVALRSGNMVHNATIIASTLESENDTLLGPADDIDPDNPGKDHITTIFIAVAVVVGVGAVGGITVGIGIYKRRQKAKRTAPSKDQCDNDYAETNRTGDGPQEKDNLQYDYAMNGPRGIVFPSKTSEMPQNQ